MLVVKNQWELWKDILRYSALKILIPCFSKILVYSILVPDYEEEVCADPGKGDATLGVGGPGPPAGDSESQLIPDRGGGKT
jgi:hypothetical protein